MSDTNQERKTTVSEQDIRLAYQLFLNRLPESEKAVSDGINFHRTVEGLRENLMNSAEFQHRAFAALAQTMPQTKVLYQSLRGFGLYLDLRDSSVSGSIFLKDKFEPYVEKELLSLVNPDEHFVDVGANVAWFSMIIGYHMEQSNGKGKVWAFEANPKLFELVCASVVTQGLTHRINPRNVAVSETYGLLPLLVPTEHAAGGVVMSKEQSEEDAEFGTLMKVPALPMDDLLADIDGRIGLMKMDIEGHEPQALRGAREVIMEHKPTIVIEINEPSMNMSSGESVEGLVSLIEGMGYGMYDFRNESKKVSVSDIKERMAAVSYWDYCCKPE